MNVQHKPGRRCPYSAQWRAFDEHGVNMNRECTLVKGRRFPPLPKNWTWGDPDVTRHGGHDGQALDPGT